MAAWPELDELKQVLDVESTDWDGDYDADLTRLARLLAAAIARVKLDVGNWDEDVDAPDERLRQAALRAVQVLRVNAPDDGWRNLHNDRIDPSLLYGHRRTFGVA